MSEGYCEKHDVYLCDDWLTVKRLNMRIEELEGDVSFWQRQVKQRETKIAALIEALTKKEERVD